MLPGTSTEHGSGSNTAATTNGDSQMQPPPVAVGAANITVKTEPSVDEAVSTAVVDADAEPMAAPAPAGDDKPADGEAQKRPSDDDGADAAEAKKPRLDEFSAEAVVEYVNESKKKYLDLLIDHVLELFFLDSLQGNIMEFTAWKKRPPYEAVRQHIHINVDEEVADLLSSKAMPEQWHHLSATKVITPVVPVGSDVPFASSATQPLPSTPTVAPHGTPSRTTSSLAQQQAAKIATGETPESGIISSMRPSQAQVPRLSRTPLTASAKTASPGTLAAASAGGGAAAYAGRARATRQHSIFSSVYESSIGSQEQIVERAKQEAHVVQRIAELRREGLWSLKRLPKCQEPPRTKAHWDYLLEEMQWLATDFAQERKWKKAAAKKCAKMITKHFQDKEALQLKTEREEKARLRKIASTIAKEVRSFWSSVEKVLDFKQQTMLEEKRKRALDMHLNFIVGQTEKYSEWLAEGMQTSAAASIDDAVTTTENESVPSTRSSDGDFEPERDESGGEDDEETIAKEEAEQGIGSRNEINMLKKESEMPIEELLNSLPPEVRNEYAASKPDAGSKSEPEPEPSTSAEEKVDEEKADDDFSAGTDEEDDEETIREQEEEEKNADHSTELKELDDEANLSLEDLYEKYKGAYAEDFEMPKSEDDQEPEEEETAESEDGTEIEDETEEDVDDEETEEDELMDEDGEESEVEEIGIESLICPEEMGSKPRVEVRAHCAWRACIPFQRSTLYCCLNRRGLVRTRGIEKRFFHKTSDVFTIFGVGNLMIDTFD